MFSTSLLPIPPPSASLLPPLAPTPAEPQHQQLPQHLQSRRKPAQRLNTPLTLLSNDERLIASRKLAIAMYGYSWLKPAGCTKTMLGRREEELEREEVERQLREVELQERIALEQEEQERREDLRRQAEAGEDVGVGERDLDDEVPEAEEEGGISGEEGEGEGEGVETDEEDMEGDLDDEVPDADAVEQESSWVYDTRREPNTESEDERSSDSDGQLDVHSNSRQTSNVRPKHPAHRRYVEQDDPATTEALVNAMLDEDELGEYEHDLDLDDDIPDMDRDLDDDMNMDMDANLSDAVPSATSSPAGWEHTDSELEESEMDISLLPPHPNSTSRNPGTTHEEMRRVSGNRMLPPPVVLSGQSRGHQQPPNPPRISQPRTAPRNMRAMMQTPATADDISALISTGEPSTVNTAHIEDSSVEPRSPNRRTWLNPSAARRNLFAGLRGASVTQTHSQPQPEAQMQPSQPQSQAQPRTAATLARNLVSGVSSGGLFTPSPRQQTPGEESSDDEAEEGVRSRTRSGRILGLGRRVRRDG